MHDQGGVIAVTAPMSTTLMTEFSHAADVARLAPAFEAALQRIWLLFRSGLMPVYISLR